MSISKTSSLRPYRRSTMALPRCRLRAYRKSAGLSQGELATLLGLQSQGLLSELERNKKRPGIEVLIGCERIFDVPFDRIFPGIARGVQTDIALRSEDLLSKRHRRSDHRKRKALAALITRLNTPHS